jgi:hypothetical protein
VIYSWPFLIRLKHLCTRQEEKLWGWAKGSVRSVIEAEISNVIAWTRQQLPRASCNNLEQWKGEFATLLQNKMEESMNEAMERF